LVADSIKAGESVWFGCEVSKRFSSKLGLEDLEIHDFALVFGTDVQITMTKADRVIYGESSMTHAMVFTAVSLDVSVLNLTLSNLYR
jgi:bleomycin hydrolase